MILRFDLVFWNVIQQFGFIWFNKNIVWNWIEKWKKANLI
jgi:hypothetical protein